MDEGVHLMILDIRWPPETFLLRKIEALARCGYRITVVTADAAKGRIPQNVRVLTLPASRRGWMRAFWLLFGAMLREPRQAFRGLREVFGGGVTGWRLGVRRWAIAAERPDIVHWEWTLAAVPCLPLIEERRGWHAVVSCRGSQVSVAPANPKRAKETGHSGRVFSRCCAVHCVSDSMVEEARALGLDRTRAAVIRPAVDPGQFHSGNSANDPARLRIAMTGALKWVRGPEHALLAFQRLLESGAEAEMEIFGGAGKQEKERFLYSLEDLGLREYVQWRGAVAADEVARRLREADIFLHASHSEGISNAVLEAMACGLPVVCTDAGGMREAVRDGIDGFVVPVRDVDAMAEALVKLARDPDLRRRMGAAARQRVLEEFTLERQTREWRALYEGLLAECRN